MNRLFILLKLMMLSSTMVSAQDIYVNSKTGNDKNTGNKSQPLKTIGEAAKRINSNNSKEACTIILTEGIYALTETALFNNNKFTEKNRLTIKAEVMPDDSNWNPQRMPLILSVMNGTPTDNDGEESRGLDIEASHVTIEGIRFAGSPAYYYIKGFQDRRYYPIWRDGNNLEDLVVTQCLFAGNVDVLPVRVAVIANGHGLVLDHCVFYNCQNAVVFWNAQGGSSYKNAMRYCFVYESNYSGVWSTTATGDDFEFHHNIIANCHTAWIRDDNSTHHYQIHDCIFANNGKITGNGGDNAIHDDFLKMERVKLSGNVEIEKDQSRKNYLQLKEGSEGSDLHAGLFKK